MSTTHEHEEGRFNLSAWALRHQALVVFLIALATAFGILAYTKLAQSEDPPFTFKVMVIRTFWPGATARQVQEEVTDRIARKLQETPDIDFLRSYSRPGESLMFFTIKDAAPPSRRCRNTWYQVRKKVGDIAVTLPHRHPGAVLQRRIRRRLHQYLCARRRRLLRRATARLRGASAHGAAAGARMSTRSTSSAIQEQRIYVEIANAQLAKLSVLRRSRLPTR